MLSKKEMRIKMENSFIRNEFFVESDGDSILIECAELIKIQLNKETRRIVFFGMVGFIGKGLSRILMGVVKTGNKYTIKNFLYNEVVNYLYDVQVNYGTKYYDISKFKGLDHVVPILVTSKETIPIMLEDGTKNYFAKLSLNGKRETVLSVLTSDGNIKKQCSSDSLEAKLFLVGADSELIKLVESDEIPKETDLNQPVNFNRFYMIFRAIMLEMKDPQVSILKTSSKGDMYLTISRENYSMIIESNKGFYLGLEIGRNFERNMTVEQKVKFISYLRGDLCN